MNALLQVLLIVIACVLLFGGIIATYHYCTRTAASHTAEWREQRFHADELELEQLRDSAAWRVYWVGMVTYRY